MYILHLINVLIMDFSEVRINSAYDEQLQATSTEYLV